MSHVAARSESSNHGASGPGAFVVRIGFLLGIIAAFMEGLQCNSHPVLRHARWGARW